MVKKGRLAVLGALVFVPACTLWTDVAAAQVVSLSVASIPFGNVAVANTSARSLRITNAGTSNLIITSIVATNAFQSSNCGSTTLTPNGTCSVSVSFTPPTTGSFTGTLTITDNASNSPQTVSLNGTGVLAATLNPTSLTFPNQAIGTASLPKTLTLVNNQAVPLNIGSVTTIGSFTASGCPSTLAAQASCVISVTFTPSVLGANTGALTVTDSANDSPQTASFTGSGVQPVTFSASGISFGNQVINTTSAPKTVTLTNNQSVPLNISSITATPAVFAASSCATPVPPSGSCVINVTFTPSATGSFTGTLTVLDDASTSPQTITSSGTGIVSVSLTPAVLQFASQVVGTTSKAATVTLTNSQSTPLSVTSVTTTGPFAAIACPASIPPSGSCTISVTFSPLAAGQVSGTLTVVDGASSSPQTATLQGVGAAVQLTSITVTPAGSSTPLGTTEQFTATGNYNNGTTANITNSVTWASSTPGVATITAAGLASTVATGATTLTATSAAISGSTALTVSPPALVAIAVTPADPSIASGTTQQFTATGTYTDGSTNNLTNSVTWISSNTATANITGGGLVTGLAVASATISATSGSITGSTTVTVTPAVLTTITLTPLNPSDPSGATQQFTATGTFSDGSTQNLTNSATWSSSSNAIATINTIGLGQTLAQGSVTISASFGSVTGTDNLTVTAAALTSIAVTPGNPSVALGTTQQFTATGTFTDGSSQNLTGTATWASTATGVATVNSTGLATSAGDGMTTITATSGSISGSASFSVTPAALVSIAISPSAAMIGVGATQQFFAIGTYTDGSTQDLTTTAYWTSSVASVATVSDAAGSQGLATGAGLGTTTITATLGTFSGSANFTVTSTSMLVSIAVSPGNPTIPLGTAQQFTATGTYADGTTADLTATATWTSSPATVAPISISGLASSASQGSTTITATSGSVSGSTLLTVSAPALNSIAITPANSSVPLGMSVQFTATGIFTDGSQQDLTATVTWSTSTTSVIMGNNGLAATAALGATTITATSGSVSAQTTLTVTLPALVSILVAPANPSIPAGATQQFAATGTYTDGSQQNLTSLVTWLSSNPAVASVNGAGLATSSAAGSSTISATLGTIVGTSGLTVISPALVSIAVTPASSSVVVGIPEQFTATGTFTDGSTQNLTSTGVTWSAGGVLGGNSTLGTISTSGLYDPPATAPNPPQVTITATSTANPTISGNTTLIVIQINLTVAPTTAQVPAGATQQFAATVTGPSNTAVTWSVGGVAGGNSTLGTVSNTGLYTAPATVPTPPQLTVAATSAADGVTSANATVTVLAQINVIVSPANGQFVAINGSKQFTATVTGTSNMGVTWSAGGIPGGNILVGTISSSGFYSAPPFKPNPNQMYITATSLADPTKSASVMMTLESPQGVSLTISPVSWWMQPGEMIPFLAKVVGSSNGAVTWSVNGVVGGNSSLGTINASGVYTAPNAVPVPPQVTVTGTSVANPSKSASGTVTIAPGLFSATPLVDFEPGQQYLGEFSGLLYNGGNTPPPIQQTAGLAAAALVQPLDANGNPSPSGKMVLISLSMSEGWDDWCDGQTTCTSYSFVGQAASHSGVNHTTLAIVNGASSGTNAIDWTCASGNCPLGTVTPNQYDRVRDGVLTPAGLTEEQVQVVWIQQANPSPTWVPPLPSVSADAYAFEYNLGQTLRALKIRWPNVHQVFISSRIYAGYATGIQNPEPYAYEYGFSVKWLVNAQITQQESGIIDPLAGDLLTAAPWVDWGPYLWGNDSNNPPGSIALNWLPNDFVADGIHPSNYGVTQVGGALMNFFLTSPYTPWFRQ